MTPDENRIVKKRDLRNLLTSYADEADVFTEIVQNALDAIRTAFDTGLYQGKSPKLTIFLGRRSNESHYFAVQDNGIGMSPETAAKFTAPGFSSLKKMGKTVGYKGVGASFFFAASNRISFRTVDPTGIVSSAGIVGSLQWVLNDTSPLPIVNGSFDAPQAVIDRNSAEHGTAVVYYFDTAWKPSSLTYVVRKEDDANLEIEHWAFFLCCRTSLGRTQTVGGIEIEVEFVLDRGDGDVQSSTWRMGEWSPQEKKLGYPFPHKVLKVAHSIKDIENTPDHSKTRHNRKYQAVREFFTKDQILSIEPKIDFTDEEVEFIEDHLDFVEIFFAYSTDVLKEINNRSGCRAAPIRYGIKLSVDGVPQGRSLDFDLTSNQGLGRQAHCVIGFSRLELDVGRKIPANEAVAEVVRKIGVRMMTVVGEFRWAMRIKDRPDIATDLSAWLSSVETRSKQSIVRHLFKLAESPSPLEVDPDSENDVIYLFGAMIAKQFLKGYRVRALSGSARYDGLLDINHGEGTDLYSDPLSRRDAENTVDGIGKVLEFKYAFSSLIDDFESKKKNPREIDVAVVWTLPILGVNRGSIEYCYDDKEDVRPIYGGTHIWRDENDTSRIPIICLQHVCALLSKSLESKDGKPGFGTGIYAKFLEEDRDQSI